MGQESCFDVISTLRCCVGVGVPTLPGPSVIPGWVPRKESLRLDPTLHLLARKKWEKKLHFDPSTYLPISKPVWCLKLTLPQEPTGSLQQLPRKMGNVSLTHPYSLGEPNLPAPRRVSEHCRHSKTAWGGPAQKVLVLWWAACQHNSFIPQGGQTWLGNIHPLLSVPRNRQWKCWYLSKSFISSRNWPLQPTEFKGQLSPTLSACFWRDAALLHWFLPHPPFPACAGLIWPAVWVHSHCAAAHHLWHQQKCVMQIIQSVTPSHLKLCRALTYVSYKCTTGTRQSLLPPSSALSLLNVGFVPHSL